MNLEQAIELVINEAESSALGEGNQLTIDACEILSSFYEDHGYHFSNYSMEETGNPPNAI